MRSVNYLLLPMLLPAAAADAGAGGTDAGSGRL